MVNVLKNGGITVVGNNRRWRELNKVWLVEQGVVGGLPHIMSEQFIILAKNYPDKNSEQLEGILNEMANGENYSPAKYETVNQWYCGTIDTLVVIRKNLVTGKREHRTMRGDQVRAIAACESVVCSRGWSLKAEFKAIKKLRSVVKPHIFREYLLTGCIMEYSPRSRLVYLVRRGRPTLAIRGEPLSSSFSDVPNQDNNHILAALCFHPVGYYKATWAGAMVPTDDVIAHLLYIRGDEHLYWRKAVQHSPDDPMSGV